MARLNSLTDVRIIFSISLLTVCVIIVLAFFIILLILFTKTLHSPANLLVCNTCVATILYVIITTIKLSFFYMETTLSDWSCRITAYLGYTFLTMVVYSYVIQGLSRLFFIVFYQHRHLLSYKFHILLILCQVFLSFLLTLSSLITKDIVFRPSTICYIPSEKVAHLSYFFISTYFLPFLIVVIFYVIIYRRVTRSGTTLRPASQVNRRELELMRNIVILFVMFLLAGIPSIVANIVFYIKHSPSNVIYMVGAMGALIAIAIEKIYLIFVNKELRKEAEKVLRKLGFRHAEIYPCPTNNNRIGDPNTSKCGNRLEDRGRINGKQVPITQRLPNIN